MKRTAGALVAVCCFAGALLLSGQHPGSHWQPAGPDAGTPQIHTPPLPTRAR